MATNTPTSSDGHEKPPSTTALTSGTWREKVSLSGERCLALGQAGGLTINKKKTVYLLLDVSISMEGDKLRHAKRGAQDFAQEAIRKGYEVGVIVFGSDASIISSATSDSAALREDLAAVHTDGSTDMAAGIRLGRTVLDAARGERILWIVTDGAPDSEEDALFEAQLVHEQGIEIMTLGTEDANHRFLQKLATRSELTATTASGSLAIGMADMTKLLPG